MENTIRPTLASLIQSMPDIIGIDHIYITVSDMQCSEEFYDRAMKVLGFRKNTFAIGGDPHAQYFNRQFGLVIRPARSGNPHDAYSPGLHHLCLRVESPEDVRTAARELRAAGIDASEAAPYPEYAPDYWATFFRDPDGIRLEITNYRQERRERHDHWDRLQS
ncbi:VOC family protein [Noviherbaspirillum sp.]|uniref:VOC family protein n=1 Tax=Noviherbaspirillum sp. TaxID=1926288 RepID=UPI002B49F9BA|nr:VOC family protein [Noviherbaspirillum sp.]HJV81073.1 VOC family protein [Noviherbaspirillum sp.]